MSSVYDVIVVGLGAAGAAAVSRLAGSRRVLALEASSRVGGRVHSQPFGEGTLELGAEWIHGEVDCSVYELARANQVPLQKQIIDMEVWRSDGLAQDTELCQELLDYCFAVADDDPTPAEPLGDYVTRKFYSYISDKPQVSRDADFCSGFLALTELLVNNYNATNDWSDMSTAGSASFQHCEGHQHWSWGRAGYSTLFQILLNTYNGGAGLPAEILLEKEVTKIVWPQEPRAHVRVHCADGSQYSCHTLILTLSLGVLKERHKEMFEPPLPEEKVRAIEALSMGVMDKICLRYDTPWWPQTKTFFGFLWRAADKAIVAPADRWITQIFGYSVSQGSGNVITLWTSGECAKEVEIMPAAVVKQKCRELLQMFAGPEVLVPDAVDMIRSSWYHNRLTRGSYSFRREGAAGRAACAGLRAPLGAGGRVLFAGEATHAQHYSTVHGALHSGYREAERALAADASPARSKI